MAAYVDDDGLEHGTQLAVHRFETLLDEVVHSLAVAVLGDGQAEAVEVVLQCRDLLAQWDTRFVQRQQPDIYEAFHGFAPRALGRLMLRDRSKPSARRASRSCQYGVPRDSS
ncbi:MULTISPECIES: hypothetical protein [Streptomyces]|uniref:hypothetical protein n=1 Tax=Streptomyces TaxID=1883 RepID=UPI000A35F84F|nr:MULTISPECIES: hypothetical protein [Streptomyces]MDX3637124.1 hypothetical protein [Streptomyces europaeiscabiei]MDX3655268.1 hypothetical protein [Streptomyces europaeiscabiei]WRZ53634.1 hypothetical protein OG622_45525 [Streptomyces sp. NBC_01314]